MPFYATILALYMLISAACDIDLPATRKITFYWVGEDNWGTAVADYPLRIDLEKLESGGLHWCAVSRELRDKYPYGTAIWIEDYGLYFVHDCTAARIKNTVDILVPRRKMERHYKRVWVIFRKEIRQ